MTQEKDRLQITVSDIKFSLDQLQDKETKINVLSNKLECLVEEQKELKANCEAKTSELEKIKHDHILIPR